MRFFTILLVAASALSAGAQTALRYQMKPGEKLEYHCANKVDINTTQMGKEQKSSISTKAVMNINAEQSEGDKLVFTSALASCTSNIKMPDQGIKDSSVTLTPVLGKRMRQTMTAFGKIISSAIVDTPNIDDQLMLVLSQNASDLSNIWMEFGSTSVKPGDTWKVKQCDTNDAPGDGKVYTTTTIKYHYLHNADTLKHACAVIGYSLGIAVEGSFKNPLAASTEMTVDGDGKANGTLYIDVTKGVLVADNSKLEVNQSLSVSGQADPVLISTKSAVSHVTLAE